MKHKKYIVVQEDTNLYNTFDIDDFDVVGWYLGHKDDVGYNIEDFEDDIVYETNDFEDAERWIDKQLGYED